MMEFTTNRERCINISLFFLFVGMIDNNLSCHISTLLLVKSFYWWNEILFIIVPFTKLSHQLPVLFLRLGNDNKENHSHIIILHESTRMTSKSNQSIVTTQNRIFNKTHFAKKEDDAMAVSQLWKKIHSALLRELLSTKKQRSNHPPPQWIRLRTTDRLKLVLLSNTRTPRCVNWRRTKVISHQSVSSFCKRQENEENYGIGTTCLVARVLAMVHWIH